MAFPDTILPITVELYLGDEWTTVSSDVREQDEIRIRRGRQVENGATVATTCAFVLKNGDGRYTPENPRSPYFGQLGKNTPVRVSVDAGSPYLALTGEDVDEAASTPDTAALDITGDIDVRIDVTSSVFQASDDIYILASKDNGTVRSWQLLLSDAGHVHLRWSTDGTDIASDDVQSTAPLIAPRSNRTTVRATLDVNNGASGHTVTFWTGPSVDGPWTQLGDPVVQSGTTSIHASNAPVVVAGDGGLFTDTGWAGRVHAFQLRNGIGGTPVADIDFGAQTLGATSFVGDDGLTWTLTGGATLSNRRRRFVGEISSWAVRWSTGGRDVRTEIEAAGILRRLDQGVAPLRSALRRRIPQEDSLLAYWPFEDEDGSTRVASAMPRGPLLNGRGLDFAADSTLAGSAPLARFDSDSGAQRAVFFGSVPATTEPQWSVEFAFRADTLGAVQYLLRIGTTGTVDSWSIGLASTGLQILAQFDGAAGGLVAYNETWANLGGTAPVGAWYRCELYAQQFGGSINLYVRIKQGDTVLMQHFISRANSAVGRVTGVGAPTGGYSAGVDGISIGHVAVFSDSQLIFDRADLGYGGETAGERIARLCAEESVPLYMHGTVAEQEQVGAQGVARFLELLQEAADADHGILYEEREETALGYQGRIQLYNQTPDLTLRYTDDGSPGDGLVAPLEPDNDDRYLRNDITVRRTDGSSARDVLEEGPLSILPPPDGAGIYPDEVPLALYEDDQLPQHAGWLLHLGTWPNTRYPTVKMLLQNAPHMVDQVLATDLGSRIDITDPPDWLAPETMQLLAQGYDELLHQYRWELTFNTTPGRPWNIGVVEDPTYSRVDTAGSELATAAGAADTTLLVTSDSGRRWITTAADPGSFPFDLRLGGERVTVTACTGAAQDGFGRTVASGWGTADVGGAWTATGGLAANFAVGSGIGTHTMTTTNVSRRTSLPAPTADFDLQVDISISALPTGGSMFASLMARALDGDNLYMARLEFTTSSGLILALRERAAAVEATLGAAFTVPLTVAAGTFYRLRFQGAGTTLRARAWLASGVEPDLWHVSTTDATLTAAASMGCRSILSASNTNVSPVLRYDGFALRNPQALTVTRSANGITKPHAAGADIRLADATHIAL